MFKAKRMIFEKDCFNYDIGNEIYNMVKDDDTVEVIKLKSNTIKGNIPNNNELQYYDESKKTLVFGIKKGTKFQTCKPSAHYQLPLVSGCLGRCEYCYLNTRLTDKQYVKANCNINEILKIANNYIEERKPSITIFEGSATSDPLVVEEYTHGLRKSIEFFSLKKYGRFRFVTKFNNVDSLLNIEHRNHTEVRFSINTSYVIENYEHVTSSKDQRIEASLKMLDAGYKVGYLIAPVFIYEKWEEDYEELLISLKNKIKDNYVTFEIITHRYTKTSKMNIKKIYEKTTLDMDDDKRQLKMGQFGYMKYIYKKNDMNKIKAFFVEKIGMYFNNCDILYIL